jgi:hypothetical protein
MSRSGRGGAGRVRTDRPGVLASVRATAELGSVSHAPHAGCVLSSAAASGSGGSAGVDIVRACVAENKDEEARRTSGAMRGNMRLPARVRSSRASGPRS